jgi:hypothetical protein
MIGVNDPDQQAYFFDSKSDRPTTAAATRWGRRIGPNQRVRTRMCDGVPVRAGFEEKPSRVLTFPLESFYPVRAAQGSPPGTRVGGVTCRGAVKSDQGLSEIWEVEQIEPGRVRLQLRTGTADSPLLEVPNDYFTTVYKKVEVLPDGTVWQMLTTPQGVDFTRRSVHP